MWTSAFSLLLISIVCSSPPNYPERGEDGVDWNGVISVDGRLLTGEVSVKGVQSEVVRVTKELRAAVDLIPEDNLSKEAKALFEAIILKSELEQFVFYCSAPFPDLGPPPSAMTTNRRRVFWRTYFAEQWAAFRRNHDLLTRHAKFSVCSGAIFLGPPDNRDGASLFRSISDSFKFFDQKLDGEREKTDLDWHMCRVALLSVVTGYADIRSSLVDQGLVNEGKAGEFWTDWFAWYQANFWFLVPSSDGWRWRMDSERKRDQLGFVAGPRTMDIVPLSKLPDFEFVNGVLSLHAAHSER